MSGSPRKAIAALIGIALCTPIGTHASRVVTNDDRRMSTQASAEAPMFGPWLGPPSWSRRLKLKRRRQHAERTARR